MNGNSPIYSRLADVFGMSLWAFLPRFSDAHMRPCRPQPFPLRCPSQPPQTIQCRGHHLQRSAAPQHSCSGLGISKAMSTLRLQFTE